MFLSYEQVTVARVIVTTSADFTIPTNATRVELQVVTANTRYRVDGVDPSRTVGMLFLTNRDSRQFSIEDFKNMRFVSQSTFSDSQMNAHYFGGRDV